MALPKEPRQLMINLMYLVLTAMLALNVSSEILHAFKVINESISSSNRAIQDKNAKMYKAFNDQENEAGQKARVKPYNDKAKQVKEMSQNMINYLEDWKRKVIIEAGGYNEDSTIKRLDNIDASTHLLVEKKGGDEIKTKLTELRNNMLGVLSTSSKAMLEDDFPVNILPVDKTDNNPQADWSTAYFYNMPTMAVVTLLSKFQNDIRSSEALVVERLAKDAGDIQIKFDAFQAIAIPTPSYALEGQEVTARIMLAAYNNAVNPTVTYSSGQQTRVDSGIAHWKTTAQGVGLKTVTGKVSINLGGRVEEKDYTFQYMVGSTGASIQLDKMNVFYIGVPNPITVSAAGYSLEDITVDIPGASVQADADKGKGHYIVTVSKSGTVPANIIAKKAGGGTVRVGGMDVRVKYIPDPIPMIGKYTTSIPSNVLKVMPGVSAVLKGFDFEARFVVTSFKFSMLPKRGELLGPFTVTGAYFKGNSQVQDLIQRTNPGDRIFIEDIRAVGPDKNNRPLNSLTLTLL